jgi:hypothetical protein
MLTGDADLARAVNVLPREDGLPSDIYSEIAAAARETLGNVELLLSEETEHAEGLEIADGWLAGEPEIWLNRATAKKVIMTVPYGARENAQAEYVADTIADRVEEILRREQDTEQIDALCAWVAAEESHGKSLYRLTRRRFKELRKRANADGVDAQVAKQQLRRLEVVTAYAARVIVKHLRHALAATFPCVNEFSDWLRRKANACAGLPLLWPTPLGFPVCQPKFKMEGSSASAKLGGSRTIRVGWERLSNSVEAHQQKDALLPNLIHSLDATHLALTLNEVRQRGVRGIGSIHDCLLCHPNDAEAVSQAVRKTFARLYGSCVDGIPAVLADWSDWMDGIARLMPLDSPGTVLGALDHPNGLGTRLLAAQALTDGEVGEAAKQGLSLIEDLRRLPPSRQCLMRSLLELMSEESEEVTTARKGVADREGQKKKAASATGLSIAAGIALGDGSDISEYFFS